MQPDDFYADPARKTAIERIRYFLKHPGLHTGGVLLVTGQRGSGKTRLVDEALNARDEPDLNLVQQLIRPLLGRDPVRKRRQQQRSPRGTQRIVLPISVDPFFPHPKPDVFTQAPPTTPVTVFDQTGNNTDPPQSGADDFLLLEKQREQDVLALLHNVVFGLTSFIDARGAPHRHGRTLSAWVGWFRLWFDPSALYRPQGLPYWIWLLILPIVTCLLGCGLANWLSGQLGLVTLSFFGWLMCGSLLSLPALLVAWLWLRWRDLRGLRQMGSQLYDLAHAQTMGKDVKLELNQQLNANKQWLRIPLMLLGLLLGGGGLTLSTDIPIVIAWLIVGAVVFTIGYKQQHKQHAIFGTNNKGWMITLLRRYLFQLHRAGFEPVLVVDELDKLADNNEENGQKVQLPAWMPTQLERFEQAMWRVKQSLCAEFLWILIDNGRLAQHLAEARRAAIGTELSTLVQTELFIEPMPYAEFEAYAKKRLGDLFNQDCQNCLAHWWVVFRGSLFHLRRILDDAYQASIDLSRLQPDDINKAKLVQKAIEYLTENRMANVADYAEQGKEQVAKMRSQLAASGWHRMWVWNGILDFAKQLNDPQVIAPSWVDLAKQGEQSAPSQREITDNPDALQHLGAMALLEVLFATHREGIEGIADKDNGIDQQEQVRDNYQPLRLVVKT